MIRTAPPPTIEVGGVKVRVSKRLCSQVAAAGLSAVSTIRADLSRCPDMLEAATQAHEIQTLVRHVISETGALASELRAVSTLLTQGTYADAASPLLRAAESARGHLEALRRAQADADVPSCDLAAEQASELAAALEADCVTAQGRADRIADRCADIAASALARSSERQAVELLRRFELPEVLADLVADLEPKAAVESAQIYKRDKAAALDERKAKRRAAERALVVDEIREAWA